MATTTMTTMTMNTTTGTILLPPTPPQTPPLEAKKPTTSTFHSPLHASYNTIDFEKPHAPQPQPPKPSSLPLLSPALQVPIPPSPSTTFAFEKAPPASQPSQSLLAASARLSALGWKSRSRQGPQGDCRLLQKPNRSLAVPTLLPGGVPSVVVHGPKCECREREQKAEKAGDDELVARVLALSQRSMVRERVGQQQRRRRMEEREREQQRKRERSSAERTWRKKGVFGWKVEIPKEVCRFFGSSSGSTTSLSDSGSDSESKHEVAGADHHKITDLCLACSNLDVDKIMAHLFTTNMVPTCINGRCTIPSMSSEADSHPQVETTPLFSVLRSPLFATRPKSHTAILALLLDLGADPNSSVSIPPLPFESTSTHRSGHSQSQSQSQPGRITILSAACVLGLPDALSLLLERGARVDARDTNLPLGVDGRWGKGLSALDVAITAGQEAIVEGLLRSGANVTATSSCELFLPPAALMQAGTIGGRPKPRLRSTSTACVNFNSTSRQQAQLQQQYQQQGAHMQVPQWPSLGKTTWRLSGVTPLHLASSLSGPGHLGIASMILSSPFSKADTNARTSSSSLNGGRTPLHYAAETLNLEVSSLLLSDPRTDPDATDDDGATPLALLVQKLEKLGNGSREAGEEAVELVRRLLRAGANAGVRYGTDLSLRARLLAMDDQDMKSWGPLFEEDGRGVLRGSMKRRTF
ncbi:ankyrin repeat-containing domain protein [Copromyces sp. CBS 386.78]|nr:ankyrin repeat-containing domain protein [Copromyces sp. CBS 386.78]